MRPTAAGSWLRASPWCVASGVEPSLQLRIPGPFSRAERLVVSSRQSVSPEVCGLTMSHRAGEGAMARGLGLLSW